MIEHQRPFDPLRVSLRLAIVGSRSFPDLEQIVDYVATLDPRITVVSGGAKGVDSVAAIAARRRGLHVVEIKIAQEEWVTHGKAAGPMRNTKLVAECDAMVAFWTGDVRSSPGTFDAFRKAVQAGKPVRLFGPRSKPCAG